MASVALSTARAGREGGVNCIRGVCVLGLNRLVLWSFFKSMIMQWFL